MINTQSNEVIRLLETIINIANENGLILYRYETHLRKPYKTKITYALHDSETKPGFASQCSEYKHAVFLNALEGKTHRCEAHRKLLKLYQFVQVL